MYVRWEKNSPGPGSNVAKTHSLSKVVYMTRGNWRMIRLSGINFSREMGSRRGGNKLMRLVHMSMDLVLVIKFIPPGKSFSLCAHPCVTLIHLHLFNKYI